VAALAQLFMAGAMVGAASAQSINVDFGAGSAPADTYAAAGAAGQWNLIGVLPPYVTAPLVDIHGARIAAEIYMYGGTDMLSAGNPALSGDDAAPMSDMLIGHNDPVDECLWIDKLIDDQYEVLIYAMTPDDSSRLCRVRVDDGSPGPTSVGGAWHGVHQLGVTYQRFVVQTTGGVIAFHSGLYGGYFQSGMNGVQIRPVSALSVDPPTAKPVRLAFAPNPSRVSQSVNFTLGSGAPSGRLELFDLAGRRLWSTELASGGTKAWDGRDLDGRTAPRGILFARWSDPANRSNDLTIRVVRLP
jgi:hypothetical protein